MAISMLFVDRFGGSLRFCHLKFNKEVIYDGYRNKKADLLWSCWPFLSLDFMGVQDNVSGKKKKYENNNKICKTSTKELIGIFKYFIYKIIPCSS